MYGMMAKKYLFFCCCFDHSIINFFDRDKQHICPLLQSKTHKTISPLFQLILQCLHFYYLYCRVPHHTLSSQTPGLLPLLEFGLTNKKRSESTICTLHQHKVSSRCTLCTYLLYGEVLSQPMPS